ncbi:MAG: HAMP domain-containing sensor histidine kinase [Bacteroidota bacterium]
MSIYSNKQRWKLFLVITAIIIGVLSLWYTNILVNKLSHEERKKVELWAEATRQIILDDQNFGFLLDVITNNETVPVIQIDENDSILSFRNLDSTKVKDYKSLRAQLEKMRDPEKLIVINISDDTKQYIYYSDSIILKRLYYYPFIQVGVFFLFMLIAYFAFSSARNAEQNQVWVGMSKETAHQLGTPISSLLAWIELLKLKGEADEELIREIEKDLARLETITDRFSKIGSSPILKSENVMRTLINSIEYIKSRSSDKIQFNLHFSERDEITAPLNISLFEWVIENVCKNAIDAMDGSGSIDVYINDQTQVVYIDIQDHGKGIPKSKYHTIFQPGYTTKQRGWGLGLSLSNRIIEGYHTGKIFVKNSEINKGTTIRIALKK